MTKTSNDRPPPCPSTIHFEEKDSTGTNANLPLPPPKLDQTTTTTTTTATTATTKATPTLGRSHSLPRQISVPGDSVPLHLESEEDQLDVDGAGSSSTSTPPSPLVEGRQACVVLFGCFLMAITNMGFGMCQGALQAFYARGPYHQTPESVISLVAGLGALTATVFAQVGGRAGDAFGYKPTLVAGFIIGVLGLVLAAFSTHLWQVFMTQGFLYGLSAAFTVPLVLSVPSQWFLKHRGLATGFVGGSVGLGGACNTVVIRIMITHFDGTRETLAILAGVYSIVWITALCLIKENRPTPNIWQALRQKVRIGRSGAAAKGEQEAFFKKRAGLGPLVRDAAFWSFMVAILFSCFGYFCPFSYLPTYTSQIVVPKMDPSRVTSLTTIWPLVACNLGMFLGRTLAGLAADLVGGCETLAFCLTTAGLLQVVVWHKATSFAGVMAFAVVFGMFGGAAMSLIALVIAQIWGVNDNFASAVGLGILSTGPGSVAGPALAGAVLAVTGGHDWLPFQAISGSGQIIGGIVAALTWYIGIWRRRRRPNGCLRGGAVV